MDANSEISGMKLFGKNIYSGYNKNIPTSNLITPDINSKNKMSKQETCGGRENGQAQVQIVENRKKLLDLKGKP